MTATARRIEIKLEPEIKNDTTGLLHFEHSISAGHPRLGFLCGN